jgi:hypothetical protein
LAHGLKIPGGVQGFPDKIAKMVPYFEFYRIALLLTRFLKICLGILYTPNPLKNFGLKDLLKYQVMVRKSFFQILI